MDEGRRPVVARAADRVTAPLVGRTRERAAVSGAVAALEQRASPVVVIAGEPGIGKTRLLELLAAEADSRKYVVLSGKASEFEVEVPLGAFVDALDAYVASRSPDELRRLGDDRMAELAAFMPSLRSVGAGVASRLQEERFRVLHAMRALLDCLAARRPLVLVLDDVHWADPLSLELIQYLVRHRPSGPVLVALALRPRQAPSLLRRALEVLVGGPHDERIELRPLGRAEADELLGTALDAEQRAAIYEESGGNPFYLVELARRVERHMPIAVAGGELARAALPGELPAAVALALAEEIESLSSRARTVVWAAAAAGEQVEIGALVAATQLPEDDVLVAVDELCGRDLLRATELPREFRFRHPLVRRAVYESAPPGWLLATHERLAAALAAREAPMTLQALHVERCAPAGDREAVTVLVRAARETQARAPAIAARWYRAALRLLPPDAVAERAELLVPLATTLGATGLLHDSLAVLHDALVLLPPDALDARAELTAFCAAIEHLLGRHREAHDRLTTALEAVADDRSLAAAALAVELAVDGIYLFDPETGIRWATRAREVADAQGDLPILATAVALQAFCTWHAGRPGEAEPYRVKAAALVDRLDDSELALRLDAPYYLGWSETFLERFDDALSHFDRGLAVSRATGRGYLYVPMLCGKGYALCLSGRLAQAADVADRAVESSQLAANHQGLLWSYFTRCWAATAMGDLSLGLRLGGEAIALGSRFGAHILLPPAAEFYALALLVSGDPTRAIEVLLTHGGGPELLGWGAGTRCHASAILCEAELLRGDRAAAERWATFTETTAAPLAPLRRPASLAARCRAAVLFDAGEQEAAAERAMEAASAAREARCPIEEGRALTLAGQAFAAIGNRESALQALGSAEEVLAACGAERWREAAAHELRALGGRPPVRRRTAPDEGLLSPREREIAALIAEGRTNRQIGSRLYISERTVETHVRHVLAKLGVTSRAAVAAALARNRPGGDGGSDFLAQSATTP